MVRRSGEVFLAFLRLGVTSFGGPIAHLGYFRDEFVARRRWLTDEAYADLVALCQFLPGPASSQVGFALGWRRAGLLGAIAAFLAFTLPSAIILVAVALGAQLLESPIAVAVLGGLKVVAVAIVAQAVLGMARNLTPDARRAAIAVGAVLVVLVIGGTLGQVAAIVLGAGLGLWLCRGVGPGAAASGAAGSASAPGMDGTNATPAPGTQLTGVAVQPWAGWVALAAFVLLLVGLPLAVALGAGGPVAVIDGFYRAGALVFGGGHVVLPLLETEVVGRGWVTADEFLTGYGAAQAVPGPLFTFAAYLGAVLSVEPTGLAGAAVALVAIFLPGFLLLVAVLPRWERLRGGRLVRAAMHGANAAVVGLLAAALYDPVFVSGITGPAQFGLGVLCFVLLVALRVPSWAVVLVGAGGGIAVAALTGGL
ncbi:MAG: chromate efflux transporter [Microbacteriaceae bacterium]|nr:chromate efflux transporter [Microbacteriaceae bacterium]